MVLKQGVDLALQRILPDPVEEPEQLARQETPIKRVRIPPELLEDEVPPITPPVQQKVRIPPELLGQPSTEPSEEFPVRGAGGEEFTPETLEGFKQDLTNTTIQLNTGGVIDVEVRDDFSIWTDEGQRIGTVNPETGEITPFVQPTVTLPTGEVTTPTGEKPPEVKLRGRLSDEFKEAAKAEGLNVLIDENNEIWHIGEGFKQKIDFNPETGEYSAGATTPETKEKTTPLSIVQGILGLRPDIRGHELEAILISAVYAAPIPAKTGFLKLGEVAARGGAKGVATRVGQVALAPLAGAEVVAGKTLSLLGKPLGRVIRTGAKKIAETPLIKEEAGFARVPKPKGEVPEVAREIKRYEFMRGRTARALDSTPDEPTLLAQRGESEAFLSMHGKGSIEMARQDVKFARTSWLKSFGGKKNNPQMEEAIIRAERVLAEAEKAIPKAIPGKPKPKAPKPKGEIPEAIELRALHDLPARAKGFSKVSESEVKDYLNRLKVLAEKEAPGEVPNINEAKRALSEGDIHIAQADAEKSLSAIHTRFRTTHPEFELKPATVPLPKPPPVKPEQPPVVKKVLDLLQQTKKERAALEKLKTRARQPKFAELETRLAKAETFEEVSAAKGALKGKLLPEGADITPIRAEFTAAEEAELIQAVIKAPVFKGKIATAYNTAEALGKLMQVGKIPTIGERKNIIRALGKQFEQVLAPDDTRGWTRFTDILMEVVNTPKTTMSMLDHSAGLRQGLFAVPRHPIISIKAIYQGAKAGMRQKWFDGIVESISKNRFAPEADAFGLPITEVTGNMLKREEAYLSGWLMKIAGDWGSYSVGKKIISAPLWPVAQVARMSARGFVATLNKQRMDIFSKYAALWEGSATEAELKAMASFIGVMTGRGTLPRRAEPLVNLLNLVMFSPRLQLSRMQFLAMPVTLWRYPPRVRRYVIGNMVAFYSTMVSLLGMTAIGIKAAGLEDLVSIEKDPRSTDFGKIRVGDTRLDPWGGLQQYMRLFARLATGETKTAVGKIAEIDREQELLRFWRTKENPFVGLIHDLFKGETFLGEELTTETEDVQNQVFERTAPFFIRDVLDALKNDGLLGGIVASPGFFGVGILSYPSRSFADWLTVVEEATGKTYEVEEMGEIRLDFNKAQTSWLEYSELPAGKSKDTYLESNPDIEASLYFWGEIKTLSTPEARDKVNEMLEELDLPEDILPIREIDPWEPEDKEEPEIWSDLLNMVPKYASDFMQENESEWRGKNLETLIPQIDELKVADRKLIDKYNRIALDADDRFKAAFLKDNPDIDAARLFWKGYKTPHSKEALELLKAKADSLGIPYDAIPALQRKSVSPQSQLRALLG